MYLFSYFVMRRIIRDRDSMDFSGGNYKFIYN